jgi:hypothetical protein
LDRPPDLLRCAIPKNNDTAARLRSRHPPGLGAGVRNHWPNVKNYDRPWTEWGLDGFAIKQ